MKVTSKIPYEKGAYYIFDKDYNDFSNLFKIEQIEENFVVCTKAEYEVQVTFLEAKLEYLFVKHCSS